jgi:hypothetical protein
VFRLVTTEKTAFRVLQELSRTRADNEPDLWAGLLEGAQDAGGRQYAGKELFRKCWQSKKKKD